ncbi:MAG: CvpA family protein, partial [Bacteroidales bacterium]
THLVGRIVESVVKIVMLGFLNKIAGAAFGILKISLVLSGLFYILHTVDVSDNLISKETKEKSLLYKPVSSLVYVIMPAVENLDWKDKSFDSLKKDEDKKDPEDAKSKEI